MLRQIVINDQRVHAIVAEIFAHRAAGVGREELKRRGFGRGCGDDDGILHRACFFERADDLRNCRTLLADGDIDAEQLVGVVLALVAFFLIDEGIEATAVLPV